MNSDTTPPFTHPISGTLMIKTLFGLSLLVSTISATAAEDPYKNYREGTIGTRFISSSGSSMYSYWLLTDLKVIERNNLELKLIHRSSYESEDLSTKDTQELVMVNCKKKTYTTSTWLAANNNNYGFKQYQAGDALKWSDDKEFSLGYPSNVQKYFGMLCTSV